MVARSRLMAAASPKRDSFGLPETGMWLVYHAVETGDSLNLAETLEQRINATDPVAQLRHAPREVEIGGRKGLIQWYARTESEVPNAARALVVTPWGICEFHLQWTHEWERSFVDPLLASVRLKAPRPFEGHSRSNCNSGQRSIWELEGASQSDEDSRRWRP